jgi:hypothetical protein
MALCGAAALISTSALVGCSSQPDGAAQKDNSGQVQVVAMGLTASDVTAVAVTVTGGPAGSNTTFNLLKASTSAPWTGVVSGLPVGSTYTFTMTATGSTGAVLYQGSASSVAINANTTTEVLIPGQQATAPTALNSAAPVIDSVILSSVTAAPGDVLTLAANAHAPNSSDPLTYSWSAAAGTFSAPSASTTTWTAPATAGTYPVLLTVQDQTNSTTVSVQASIVVNASNAKGSAHVGVTLNTWPVVTNIAATPNYLVKGAQTPLTAIASDSDHDPITYAWTSSCAGTFTNTQVPTPGFTLASTSTDTSCTLSVAVADNRGGSTSGSLTLPVGQPTTALAPSIGQTVQSTQLVGATDTVSMTVNATDPQGLPLTFAWAANGGTLGTATNTAGSSQVVWTPPASATSGWLVTATVTDSSGAAATKAFSIKPTSCFGVAAAPSTAWSFGVMADTQWISTDDGKNPNSVAVDIINQLNSQFIAKGVKLVVAVGDVTDNGSNLALDTRAEFAQALYNANIGFFPLRGNHESSTAGAAEFKRVFPQTMGGMQNATPANAFIANADDVNTLPTAVSGSPFAMGANFSEPSSVLTGTGNTAWDGLSYSFDYNNARFVLLDQFMMANGTSASGNYQIKPQQAWISTTLAGKPTGGHVFEFAHKGLITENHTDTLFGSDPSQDAAGQDAFIASLANNGVRYHMGGHDHMHNRAIVTTTDGTTAKVQNIICASDSSKFYIPANPSNDVHYDAPATTATPPGFGHTRETPIAQELNTVGYYIVTVDGVKATVDFYSAPVNPTLVSGEYLISYTPQLNFTKRETYGYGLNGKQFVVAQGSSYTVVQDSFSGTNAQILAGTNANTNVEGGGRNPVKTVDSGWNVGTCSTSSAILSLWMTDSTMGSDQVDTYALSMSYDSTGITPAQIASGAFGLAVKDAGGNWVNAVNKDFGGTKTFVQGPWQASYALGTYGVDTSTTPPTAWAVINHSSDFAVASFSN